MNSIPTPPELDFRQQLWSLYGAGNYRSIHWLQMEPMRKRRYRYEEANVMLWLAVEWRNSSSSGLVGQGLSRINASLLYHGWHQNLLLQIPAISPHLVSVSEGFQGGSLSDPIMISHLSGKSWRTKTRRSFHNMQHWLRYSPSGCGRTALETLGYASSLDRFCTKAVGIVVNKARDGEPVQVPSKSQHHIPLPFKDFSFHFQEHSPHHQQ